MLRSLGVLALCAALVLPAAALETERSSAAGAFSGPTGLKAEAGDGQVTLSWDPVPGAMKYRVARCLNGIYTTLSANNVTGEYTAKRLQNGTTYGFAVKAYTQAGWTSYSGKVYATPMAGKAAEPAAAPAHVTATAWDGQVTLSWDPVPGATKYRIARYRNGRYIPLRSNNITGEYTVKRLQNGTTYVFAVAAYNGSAWSGYGDRVHIIPTASAGLPPRPQPPQPAGPDEPEDETA